MNKFEINNGHITIDGTPIKGMTELTIAPVSMDSVDRAKQVVVTMKIVVEMAEPAPTTTDTGSKIESAISAGLQAALREII